MTPKLVTLKFSNDLDLLEVFKKGYKNKGMCALKKYCLVCGFSAKHCNNPKTLQILDDCY